MTIRGGGNPYTAMAAMPLGEWTRRLGALPAEAYDCFMVGTLYGFNRIQAWFARDCSWPMAGSPRIIAWQTTQSRATCRSARIGQGQANEATKQRNSVMHPLTKKVPYKPYGARAESEQFVAPHLSERRAAGGAKGWRRSGTGKDGNFRRHPERVCGAVQRARRRGHGCCRPTFQLASAANRPIGNESSSADHIHAARICRGWRADELWREHR